MLAEFARDEYFTIAWFGLMAMVWWGWAQEAPPAKARAWLGAGSLLGLGLAGGFGAHVVLNWSEPSALEGRYHWFGVIVLVEVLAAVLGAVLLARRGAGRWIAWWVAVVVAAHFIPLAPLLQDWSLAALGAVQLIGLGVIGARSRGGSGDTVTSWPVGLWMGLTLLGFGAVAAALSLT